MISCSDLEAIEEQSTKDSQKIILITRILDPKTCINSHYSLLHYVFTFFVSSSLLVVVTLAGLEKILPQ